MIDRLASLWSAPDPTGRAAHRFLETLLIPAEWVYGGFMAARNWSYDRGLLRSVRPTLPTIGIGNLTVGGTGKTPMTAWLAARLQAMGRSPGVVMRGYGGDELEVHRLLNPGVPVIRAADRVAGVEEGARRGLGVVLLDDCFQHRAIEPLAQIVLLAAEEGIEAIRLLPRGRWRESLGALHRADLVVVTRKTADAARARAMVEALRARFGRLRVARAHLSVPTLVRYEGGASPLAFDSGVTPSRCALAVAGVARPESVWTQLRRLGVDIEMTRSFPDHHRYSKEEIREIARHASRGPLIMTLKDLVKLAPALGAATEIYIPQQRIEWESGGEQIDRLLSSIPFKPSVRRDRLSR